MSDEKNKLINKIMKENNIKGRLEEQEEEKPDLPERLRTPIRKRQHSLGNHPALPKDDDRTFEEKNLLEKYRKAINDYKRHHDVDYFEESEVIHNLMNSTKNVMNMEKDNRENLQELAIRMVRDEYDVPEEDIEMDAQLIDSVEPYDMDSEDMGEEEMSNEDLEVEDEEEKERVNKEVEKRRLINSIIQGASVKGDHMFHMAEDELSEMNPRLAANYSKLVSEFEYQYMSGMGLAFAKKMKNNDSTKPVRKAGDVNVEFPQEEGDRPVIRAKACTFPVLVQELVKGVMEILSSHGLPEDENIRNFVIEKADRVDYEIWDLILGPCIWEKLLMLMKPDDVIELKQYVYSELVCLPPDEFHDIMREILGQTKRGEEYVNKLSDDIRNELEHEDYEREMEKYREDLGGTDDPNDLDQL